MPFPSGHEYVEFGEAERARVDAYISKTDSTLTSLSRKIAGTGGVMIGVMSRLNLSIDGKTNMRKAWWKKLDLELKKFGC